MQHDLRLAQALQALRITRCPYAGAVALREPGQQREVLHVIDQWRYLGIAHTEDDVRELASSTPPSFDLDTYHILLRRLKDHPAQRIERHQT